MTFLKEGQKQKSTSAYRVRRIHFVVNRELLWMSLSISRPNMYSHMGNVEGFDYIDPNLNLPSLSNNSQILDIASKHRS